MTELQRKRHEYYLKHREQKKAYSRLYSKTHREQVNLRNKAWRDNNPDKLPYIHRKSRYGLTAEAFHAMLVSQNHCCAICGLPFGDMKPHVDHDHVTNEVRGLLHNHCNRWLGVLENVTFCTQAQDYLERLNA